MELVPKAPLQTQEILGTPECRWANNWAIRFFLASGASCCSSYRRWTSAGAELLRAFGGYWAQVLLWLGVRPIHQRLGLEGWYLIIGQFPGTLILEHRGLHGQKAPCSIFFFFSCCYNLLSVFLYARFSSVTLDARGNKSHSTATRVGLL